MRKKNLQWLAALVKTLRRIHITVRLHVLASLTVINEKNIYERDIASNIIHLFIYLRLLLLSIKTVNFIKLVKNN